MPRQISHGTCYFCNKTFSKSGMARHLRACKQRAESITQADRQRGRRGRLFHLVVEGRYRPMYWLHVEIPSRATLLELDDFLRQIWLECCGHLSAFRIGETSYLPQVDPMFDFLGEPSMAEATLGGVLTQGERFYHEYDFGTTTELSLRMVSEREGPVRRKPSVEVLARNEPPDLRCDRCGQPAADICTECLWDGRGLLCEACADGHECGEEMLLPVVNSPRTGMCAYAG